MAGTRSSSPGWPAFIVVVTVLAVGLVAGFALLWMRMDEAERRAAAADAELTEARSALAAAELAIEEQATGLTDASSDIESLAGAVGDLGKTVEIQSQRTLDVAALRRQVSPSVVTVNCDLSQGTGFAIGLQGGPQGYPTAILTNYHVIADCVGDDSPQPSVEQGSATPATLLAEYDAENDLALLYIDQELPPLTFADASDVGDPVLAIGAPYGYTDTVTSGIVTNIERDVITTDAAVGPGNSGGPLVDRSGQVLGVVTAELEYSEGQNLVTTVSLICRTVLQCS